MSNLNEKTVEAIRKIIEKQFQHPNEIFDEWIEIFVNDEIFDCKLESCEGYKEFDCNVFDRKYFDSTYHDGDPNIVKCAIHPVNNCTTNTCITVGAFDFFIY